MGRVWSLFLVLNCFSSKRKAYLFLSLHSRLCTCECTIGSTPNWSESHFFFLLLPSGISPLTSFLLVLHANSPEAPATHAAPPPSTNWRLTQHVVELPQGQQWATGCNPSPWSDSQSSNLLPKHQLTMSEVKASLLLQCSMCRSDCLADGSVESLKWLWDSIF